MEFDRGGRLIVSSMAGAEIYRIDPVTGETATLVGPPEGLGDGLAIGPDGTIAWTALPAGEVRALTPDGEIVVLATDLPGINAIKFSGAGRLYAAQVRAGDGLYEIDINGEQLPRLVARGMDCPADGLCGLNSFDISDDNILYGPLMAKGAVVRIDLASGDVSEVARGFHQPTGVRLDSRGNLYVINWLAGTLIRLDPQTSEQELIAELPPPLDNLTVSPDETVYVSNPADNVIFAVDPQTGAARPVVKGGLVMPAGLAVSHRDGEEVLLVSGVFRPSVVNVRTGAISRPPGVNELHASFAIDGTVDRIAISDHRSGVVKLLDRGTGRVLTQLQDFRAPYDVRFLADGSLLLAEFGSGCLLKVDPGGARRVVADGLSGPLGLALAGDNLAYVTEMTAGVVSKIHLGSGLRIPVARGLDQPQGIAIDSDGQLVVAEVGAKRLTLIDPIAGVSMAIADRLPIGVRHSRATGTGMGLRPVLPTGVAVGQGSEIFVVSDRDHTVLKVTRRPL